MANHQIIDKPIVVRGLTKHYGHYQALAGIDLEVGPGEVFALLGPNGAGKTTTVEILEGIRSRNGGEVSVLGRDPADDARSWRAEVGVVPQGTGAYNDLTVVEVVSQFAAMYADPLPVDQVLEMVGLTAKRKKQARSLSGGQQRRLDVAVGVIGDPVLLFLDEPTTGLDPAARHEAWDLVRFFSDRGTTTVLTTHYLDEAEALAQRAAVIVAGRVVECGDMADLGGRSRTPSEISFRPPDELADEAGTAALRQTLGRELEHESTGLLTLRTHTPTADLERLLSWARQRGISELTSLRVHQPTLEEIYLELIREPEGAH